MHTTHDPSTKPAVLISLKKARSLLDTIISMVEKDAYCVDVMQQNLAAMGLLKAAHEKIMAEHLETCFVDGVKNGGKRKQQELLKELQVLIRLYNK